MLGTGGSIPMIPVLVGSAALISYALFGETSPPEHYGVAQWGPPKPTHVGPGFMAAVKDLGNAAGKYPLLKKVLGPIFGQVELTHNELGQPGYLRGFPVTIGKLSGGRIPLSQQPETHQALKLLESLAVIVGLRHGIQPSYGTIKHADGTQTIVVGYSTTPNAFWTGEIALFPSPEESRQILRDIGGRLPGFDPGYLAKQTMEKARKISIPTSGRGRRPGRFRLPSLKRRG